MKNVLAIVLLLFVAAHSKALSDKELKQKADALNNCYAKLSAKDNDAKYEEQFFQLFPGNFQDFVALYGFENDKPCLLYHVADKHILSVFNSISSVNDTLYYQKLIGLCSNGRWEADAVNYLQEGVHTRVQKNLPLFLDILHQYPKVAIHSFWVFYFDGPHPSASIDKNIKQVAALDPKMYDIVVSAHEYVLADQ